MDENSKEKVSALSSRCASGGGVRVLVMESSSNTSKVSLLSALDREGFDVFVLSHDTSALSKAIYVGLGCSVIYGGTLEDAVASNDIDVIFIDNPHYYLEGGRPGHDFYRMIPRSVSDRALFCYVPYAYIAVSSSEAYTDYFHRMSWKFFLESDFHLMEYMRLNLGSDCGNAFVSGHPYLDPYLTKAYDFLPDVRLPDGCTRLLTWCPHHNPIFYNQIEFWDQERELRRLLEEDSALVVAFRPHPNLFATLESSIHRESKDYKTLLQGGAVSAIKEFWLNHPRVIDARKGPIYQLFKSSDVIVHNCGGYQMEAVFSGARVVNTVNVGLLNRSALQYSDHQVYPNSPSDFRAAVVQALSRESLPRLDLWPNPLRAEAGQLIAEHLRVSIFG